MCDNKKVYCGECECWEQINVNKGTCYRKSPFTSEHAASYWPETPPYKFCWEGIPKKPEVLNESK